MDNSEPQPSNDQEGYHRRIYVSEESNEWIELRWVRSNSRIGLRRWIAIIHMVATAVAVVLIVFAITFLQAPVIPSVPVFKEMTSENVYNVASDTRDSTILDDHAPVAPDPIASSSALGDIRVSQQANSTGMSGVRSETSHYIENLGFNVSRAMHDYKRERYQAFQQAQGEPLQRYRVSHRQTTFNVYPMPKGGFRRNGKIIYFLHVHKSGGSTICSAAKFNRLRASYNTNCNVQLDQRCCGRNDTMEEMASFANSTPYEFVANEGDLFRSMDHEHYHYVVVLRDSESRYESHWKHVVRGKAKERSSFSAWWRKQPDNWTTRKICGRPCANIPKFQLNRTIFDDTLSRLLEFDDVLFLERFEDSYPKFALKVGWKPNLPPAANVANPYPDYPPLREPWDPLMSALDDVLYETALNMLFYENTTNLTLSEVALQKLDLYYREGPQRNCTGPCCARSCSSYR